MKALEYKSEQYQYFIQEWHEEIFNTKYILEIINSHLPISGKIGSILPLTSKQTFDNSQMEWISLVEKLKHPMDEAFFKPWWVPIQINDYDLFIDMSTPGYSLFELHFYFIESYCWCRNIVFPKIKELIIALDNPVVDIETFWSQTNENFLKTIDWQENKEVAYSYINPNSILDIST